MPSTSCVLKLPPPFHTLRHSASPQNFQFILLHETQFSHPLFRFGLCRRSLCPKRAEVRLLLHRRRHGRKPSQRHRNLSRRRRRPPRHPPPHLPELPQRGARQHPERQPRHHRLGRRRHRTGHRTQDLQQRRRRTPRQHHPRQLHRRVGQRSRCRRGHRHQRERRPRHPRLLLRPPETSQDVRRDRPRPREVQLRLLRRQRLP